jgi:hypothetical protein
MTSKKEQNESYRAFKKIKDKSDALKFLKKRVPSPDSNLPYTPSDYRWMTMPLVAKLNESYRSFCDRSNVVSNILQYSLALCYHCGVLAVWLWLLGVFIDFGLFIFLIIPLPSFRTEVTIFAVAVIGAAVTYLLNEAWAKFKRKTAQHFSEQIDLAMSVFEEELDPVSEWVENRYDIEKISYKQPPLEYTYITEHEIKSAILQTEKEDQQPTDTAKEVELGKIAYEWKKVGSTREGLTDRTHCILVDNKTLLEAPLLPGVNPYKE